jgi:hypothetical protein
MFPVNIAAGTKWIQSCLRFRIIFRVRRNQTQSGVKGKLDSAIQRHFFSNLGFHRIRQVDVLGYESLAVQSLCQIAHRLFSTSALISLVDRFLPPTSIARLIMS